MHVTHFADQIIAIRFVLGPAIPPYVPWPVTLVMLRARQGRLWQGRRTRAHLLMRRGLRTQPETFLAVLNAANVSGQGIGSAGTSFVRLACLAADLSDGIIQRSPKALPR